MIVGAFRAGCWLRYFNSWNLSRAQKLKKKMRFYIILDFYRSPEQGACGTSDTIAPDGTPNEFVNWIPDGTGEFTGFLYYPVSVLTLFLRCHFILKMIIILPRQARDKHIRECSTQKEIYAFFFCRAASSHRSIDPCAAPIERGKKTHIFCTILY